MVYFRYSKGKGYTKMWKEGNIKVNGESFHYWMKQYDEGSK